MFKKSKLVAVSTLGLSILFSGCGAANKVDAKEVLKAASEKMKEAKSYEMDMTMIMDVVENEESVSMTMETSGKCIVKPELTFQMDSSMDMSVNGESQNITMQQYVVKEDSQYMMYTNTMGLWGKTPLAGLAEAEAMMQDTHQNLDMYLTTIDDITISGDKAINGIDCNEIKVNITKEYFDEALGNFEMLQTFGYDEATLEATLNALSDLDGLPVYYYVSKESNDLMGCNMDMSELMKKLLTGMSGEEGDSVDELKMMMDITYNNIDGVSEITLPEEASSAVEMPLNE